MRSSRKDTEKHRSEIIEASARLFREKGVDGVSVPEIMQAVGMTHGGFYKHFKSKEELVELAYGKAFDQTVERLKTMAGVDHAGQAAAWNALVSGYLSTAHRDSAAAGCATAALAGDTARLGEKDPAHAAYQQGVKRMLDMVAALRSQPDGRAESLVALSTMVGALLLSRGTSGALSEEFLAAARDRLERPAA